MHPRGGRIDPIQSIPELRSVLDRRLRETPLALGIYRRTGRRNNAADGQDLSQVEKRWRRHGPVHRSEQPRK
jgi:hypothetical protein